MFGPYRARVITFFRSQGVALGWHVAAPWGEIQKRNFKPAGEAGAGLSEPVPSASPTPCPRETD